MTNSLFDSEHKVRYFEALRRLKYWTDKIYYGGFRESDYTRAKGCIDTLITLLETRELSFERNVPPF